MPCIDYLPSGTNTNSQRVILNDDIWVTSALIEKLIRLGTRS